MTNLTMTLAVEINAEHQAAVRAAGEAVEHALRCGELLTEQKAQIEHGEWLSWLEEQFAGTPRHAQRYMRIWRERDRLKNDTVSHLTIRGAIDALTEPRDDHGDRLPAVPDLQPDLRYQAMTKLGLCEIEPSAVHPGYWHVLHWVIRYGFNFFQVHRRPVLAEGLPHWIDAMFKSVVIQDAIVTDWLPRPANPRPSSLHFQPGDEDLEIDVLVDDAKRITARWEGFMPDEATTEPAHA